MSAIRKFPLALALLAGLAMAFVSGTSIADAMARSGQFNGLNNHVTKGMVSLEKAGDKWQIKFANDFFFDGAPDPRVALGKDGQYDAATLIRLLDSNTGEQVYEVPASVDVSQYNEVHIWCKKFSVGLGVASLN